jgi:Spy/CpxP family protein refolding chaperone
MVKKIGIGIIAAVFLTGVLVFAAESQHFNGFQKDLRAVFKGILSPRQISTLMDFRRAHEEEFRGKGAERPDFFKTWKELELSEEQQNQLLRIAGDTVDTSHPYLMTAIETGSELKRKVLEADPQDPAINRLSVRLGTEIGEIFWNLALLHNQVKSVLTPEQVRILDQLHSQRGLRMRSVNQALPEMVEELAALWTELKLTPTQADALGAAHKLITRYRQNQHVKQHDEWRTDIAKILTPGQLVLADRFHDKLIAEGSFHFLKRGEERERFQDELGLTGEQKIKLVQTLLDRRTRIVPCIQSIMNAAGGLREQVHADKPNRGALLDAAARLGDAIGQAAGVGAGLMADAREVLTTEQMDLVKRQISNGFDRRLEHARILPAKFHELIGFFNELDLNSEQKDQVVKLITEKHAARRTGRHRMGRVYLDGPEISQ